jgi:hypothetical protein
MNYSNKSWVKPIAKTGLTSKGIVYCLIGILVFMAAFEIAGTSNDNAGKLGVLKLINQQTGGKVLLAIVALGLISYSLWRAIQTFGDTNHKGNSAKGIGNRLRYLFSGLIYLSLSILAIKLLLDEDPGNSSQNGIIQKTIAKPYGEYVLGIIALAIAATGIYQVYYGLSEKFRKHINLNETQSAINETVIKSGKVGYVSRGVVWLIISWLFMQAALHSNSAEAGQSIEAFQFIERSGNYGSVLLGFMGVGLLCYGVFNILRARFGVF